MNKTKIHLKANTKELGTSDGAFIGKLSVFSKKIWDGTEICHPEIWEGKELANQKRTTHRNDNFAKKLFYVGTAGILLGWSNKNIK